MNLDELKDHLNDSFDDDQIKVSEELIQKTLRKIEQEKIQPISNQENERHGKEKRNKAVYYKRAAGAVAGLLVVVGCISMMRLGTSKSSDMAENNSTSMESADASDTIVEEPNESFANNKEIYEEQIVASEIETESKDGASGEDSKEDTKNEKFSVLFGFDKDDVEQLVIIEQVNSKGEEKVNLTQQADIDSALDTFMATDYNEVDNESDSIDFTVSCQYHITCRLISSKRVVDIYLYEDYMYIAKQDDSDIVWATYQMKNSQAFYDSFLKITSN